MTGFKIINNESEVFPVGEWSNSVDFSRDDRIFDSEGEQVSSEYGGRRYQIIQKMERTFSTLERVGRGLLGIAAVVCTLCLALFSESIRNLFTESKEIVHFAILLLESDLPSEEERYPCIRSDDKEIEKLDCITIEAPWKVGEEPDVLPEDWKKYQAKQDIIILRTLSKVCIPKGDSYFTFQGRIANGWGGTYNPPQGLH